jgi:hypothetical protein
MDQKVRIRLKKKLADVSATPETKNRSIKADRESRVMNTVTNVSIILMGMLMGGFSEMMTSMTSAFAGGIAEAVGGQEAGEKARSEINKELPKINTEMKKVVSDMRKDIYLQMEQKKEKITPILSNPIFDKGPEIVDAYDFGIPKLTEQLDDEVLAQYTYLLLSENATFAKMFGELSEWMKSLPQEKL